MKTREEIHKIVNPIQEPEYSIPVGLRYLEEQLKDWEEQANRVGGVLELIPDFQRGHVWSKEQQVRYVENFYRRMAPKNIKFITGEWMRTQPHEEYMNNIYCLDGLQRLTAVRSFMREEFKVFGDLTYQDLRRRYDSRAYMVFEVYTAATKRDAVQLYLDLNTGGTPHSQEELDRVRQLLWQAKKSK